MTTTSRVPAVIDALVSTLKTALPNAHVIDGPFVAAPDSDYLTVGWTPDEEATTATQEWAGLGNRARNEQIDIPCYARSFSGSTTMKTRRDAAFALLAAAENAVRADPTLGGVIPNPGWAQIGSYSDRPEQTKAGSASGVVFHVLVQTRI